MKPSLYLNTTERNDWMLECMWTIQEIAELDSAFPESHHPCVEDGETESYDSIGYTLELDAEMWDTTPYRLNEVLSALDYFWRVENNRRSAYMGES